MTTHGTDQMAKRTPRQNAASTFGGILLILIGAFNLLGGFTALTNDGYFGRQIVYSNLTFWGWVFVIWGALQLLAGALVLARNPTGSVVGAGLASVSAMLWFVMLFAAPWNALVGVALSLLVIHSLTIGAGHR